ncbi:hypothetical protein MASR2M15_02510 [Anaerolineales bacterium]
MTDEILSTREIEYFIKDWKLIPASGGVFELSFDGELLFSKKELKRHAEAGEIKALILKALDKVRPADFALPADD